MNSHPAIRRWMLPALLSLLLGLAVFAGVYLNVEPPAGLCADAMRDAGSGVRISLPHHEVAAPAADRQVTLNWPFPVLGEARQLAVYIGKASPFVSVYVNRRNLTPEIDLDRRDLRLFGPQLHPIPADALTRGANTLTLSLPVSSRLVVTQLDRVCIGELDVLRPVWRANQWREMGVPALCLAFIAVLGLIALTLWRLHPQAKAWGWYLFGLLMVAYRPAFLIVGVMPGGADLWRAGSDLSILLFIHAVHRLLLQFWNLPARRGSGIVLMSVAALRASLLLANPDHIALFELIYWLGTAAIGSALIVDVTLRAHHAPSIERTSLRWVLGFAIACAFLHIATAYNDLLNGMQWLYPLGTVVLMVMIGALLVRRTTTGERLLTHAMHTLGERIDEALPSDRASGVRVWDRVASKLAVDERQRMLDVIGEGFGARMLDVLLRIRNQHPKSRLGLEVRRALLDLRLMIDAVDDSCGSLGNALALLRQRMEGSLAAAGIRSCWDIGHVDDLQIASRRKLTEVFRCLEELISNAIQHAAASEVRITARAGAESLVLIVEDDGGGFALPLREGRGLRNLRLRVTALEGTLAVRPRRGGPGTSVELRLPRI